MSEANVTRIMLVDDHASFREPLAFMLDHEPGLTVVAQAGSLAQANEILSGQPEIDVAAVDLDLPDGSGIDFIDHLSRRLPSASALLLSSFSDRALIARAIEAGAAGVMHKSVQLGDITTAVKSLASGRSLLSQTEIIGALRLVSQQRTKDHETRIVVSSLTPREKEVLKALAEGWSDKEIAEHLYVGLGTIRTHITSILQKLQVNSRQQALLFAIRSGLATID